MREVEPDQKFPEETWPENPFDAVLSTGPSEESLVIIAMLMRLYDVQMAVLNEMNPNRADIIYEAHEKGEHFNPEIFIPSPVEVDPDVV